MENSSVLFIAIGNPLRGDDGLAHLLVERAFSTMSRDRRKRRLPHSATSRRGEYSVRYCHQLTPELSAEIAGFETVIFADADATAVEPILEPVQESNTQRALTHVSSPAEIVTLARALYAFRGQALQLRIPARDFSHGDDGLARQGGGA